MSWREEVRDKLMASSSVVSMGYETECYIYNGSDSGSGRGGGYGRVRFHGQSWAVHRLAYQALVGRLRDGLQIDHKCCNRKCWRPEHLKQMTHKRNQRLRASRARRA